jgi:hypothetical protein
MAEQESQFSPDGMSISLDNLDDYLEMLYEVFPIKSNQIAPPFAFKPLKQCTLIPGCKFLHEHEVSQG